MAKAARRSSSVASGAPTRTFSREGRVEQEAVLGHHADGAASGGGVDGPQVHAAGAHHARGGVGQAAEELGDGRLARSRLAHDGHGGAGGEVEVDAAQHLVARPVGEAHLVEVDGQRAAGERGAVLGSSTSIGVASTPRILRQPAMAVWVWSRISLSSEMGIRSRFTRNTKAMSVPRPSPHPGPWMAPTAVTVASVEGAEEVGEGEHDREPLRRAHLGLVLGADGVVEPAARAPLEAVGEDDGRPGDELGHLREGAADGGAHLVVGRELPALEHAQRRQQGRNTAMVTRASCQE